MKTQNTTTFYTNKKSQHNYKRKNATVKLPKQNNTTTKATVQQEKLQKFNKKPQHNNKSQNKRL